MARPLRYKDPHYIQCKGPCREWLWSWSTEKIKSVICDKCRWLTSANEEGKNK